MLLEHSQVLIVGKSEKYMQSEVVQSVNIMLAILLLAVVYVIYRIFKYDEWNPNPITHSDVSESDGSGHEELGSRTD